MLNKIDRLFVAEYESTKVWTARTSAILGKIQKGDLYLIFRTGKGPQPSAQMMELVNNMNDAKELFDVRELSEDAYSSFVLEKIKEHSNQDTYVYFLNMIPMYEKLRDEIRDVANVQSFRDYKVGRRVQQKKTVMKNPTGRETNVSYSEKNNNSDLFDSMVSITTNIEPAFVNEEKKENKNKDKKDEVKKSDSIKAGKKQEIKDEVENMAEVLTQIVPINDDISTGSGTRVRENTSDSVENDLKRKKIIQDKQKKMPKKNANEVAEKGPSISELEKMIFGNKLSSDTFKKEYTELDNQKAKMINALFDRLVKNINKLIKNMSDYQFNQAKYIEFVTVVVKSNNYDDFKESWDVMSPGNPLKINEDIYNYIYDEAQYYAKVCETLYGEDEW